MSGESITKTNKKKTIERTNIFQVKIKIIINIFQTRQQANYFTVEGGQTITVSAVNISN